MLKIGICDDSQENRQSLKWTLEGILEEKNLDHTILEFSSGEGILGWFQKHPHEMDLLFLDIEMGKVNGMETARRLRQEHPFLQMVFVTGYSDYVFDGYEVGALGYLMKPVKRDPLEKVLERALASLCRDAPEVYSCRNGDSWFRIPLEEILYFESSGRKVNCVTRTQTCTFYGKLDQVEQELGKKGFVRIHQRYLVRAAAVRQVCGSEMTVGDRVLPISRSYRQSALVALTRTALEK